jgi:hypothetical protein
LRIVCDATRVEMESRGGTLTVGSVGLKRAFSDAIKLGLQSRTAEGDLAQGTGL